jgi:hypothetical protein
MRHLVLCALAASLLASVAHADPPQPISDADRLAARDLYNQAAALQLEGKFEEALGPFMRSFEVFPAPTTALHVAQCQASLGHLVEAKEDYEALLGATVPEGSPPAFYRAQDQAKVELDALDPRIPRIRITADTEQPRGMLVSVDGVALSRALLGAARPVNPGTHHVLANAPGRAKSEQVVTVQEGEVKDVPIVFPVAQPTQPIVAARRESPPPEPGESPYTKRKDRGLYAGGIVLVSLGSLITVIGIGVMLGNSSGYNNGGAEAAGGVATLLGLGGIVGGALAISAGGQKVPVTQSKWIPLVGVGPRGASMGWRF